MSQLCLKLLHDHLQCQNNTVVDSFRNYSHIYNLLCAHRDPEGFCWWKTEDTFTWLALGIFIVQFLISKENPSKCFLQALCKMDV